MSTKTTSKVTGAGNANKPEARKAKTPKEIIRELREQHALDPARSEAEDYLSPST
ncbi:MAG: hypothetical protein ACYDCJ_09780 [Gammaproteobacteria bacterium]